MKFSFNYILKHNQKQDHKHKSVAVFTPCVALLLISNGNMTRNGEYHILWRLNV